jgi:hypothetical protein
MANSLLTVSQITRFSIPLFTNTNMFIKYMNRQFDDQFGNEGARIGAQLRLRLPNDYAVTDGPGIAIQDTNEQQVVLTVSTQRHVDVAFTSAERTLSIDDYQERVLLPRINALAGSVAYTVMAGSEGGVANITANVDANNNILPVNAAPFTTARALLVNNSAPPNVGAKGWNVVLEPTSDSRVALALQGLLNPATEISEQFRSSMMKSGLGFARWFEDQTVIKHTTGTLVSGTLAGANQSGNTLTVSALGGTINQGDVFTISGVYAVNRVTKQPLGILRQFVATASFAANATSISFYPAIIPPASSQPYASLPYTSQAYQTVTALPASNATITPFANASTTYKKNIAYAPDMATMVMAPLWMPPGGKGVIEAARHTMDNCSLRSLVTYEPATDQPIDRVDGLFGWYYPRPEWGSTVADSVP